MQLTNSELSTLRNQPHRTNLWLSIYRPRTLMSARVTGTYSLGDRQISYYATTTGSYSSLYPDSTVLIGSQAGADDAGRLRMRGATGTYVDFAENSVQWQTDMYLTFIDYVTVDAVYPRIIQDPNSAANVIFYKDYDIPYSNQNSIYGTFPCAGPHRAGFLTSGTCSFYYTATGTYNVASSALTYQWNFDGGSPTGSTALSPGNVTYSSAGHYKTRLRVTAANGAVDDTYRYVSIYDRPGVGTNTPTLRWELQEMSGSRSQGGYAASFKLYENIGNIEPNALIVIFSESWYGGTKLNIGGNASGNSSIVFVGYVISDSIKFNYKESYVEFQAGTVSELMKTAEGFSVSCESKVTPSTWFELAEMTVPRAMYHYLRWHSTVLKTTDFQYTGDDRLVQYFDADRGSLFDAVNSFMEEGMMGAVVSDRQGKLWAEINSYGLQTPFSTIPGDFVFHKQDWIGTPSIEERRVAETSFIELGGIIYYGASTDAFSACLANAPSTVPLYRGKSDSPLQGLILTSQIALNQTAGHYLAHLNSPYPNISFSMAGNYNNLDIAPIEQIRLVIDQNDSVRGKSIQPYRYIVEGMEWSYDAKSEMFRPEATLSQIATGTAGVTVLVPAVPPDGGYGYPEVELPPLPTFPSAGGEIPNPSRSMVIHDGDSGGYSGKGVIYTLDFDSSSPTWFTMNSGLTAAQYRAINKIVVTPNGTVYVAKEGIWQRGDPPGIFVARAPSLGGTFTILADQSTIEAAYPGAGDDLIIEGLGCRTDVPDTAIYMAGNNTPPFGDSSTTGVYLGTNGTFTVTMTITNFRYGGTTIASAHYGQNTWGLIYNTVVGASQDYKFHRLNSGATAETFSVDTTSNHAASIRAATTGVMYVMQDVASTQIVRSTDNGTIWQAVPSTNDMFAGGQGLACDDVGQYLMAMWSTGRRGRSSDYGTTWSGIPNLPFEGTRQFGYLGGTGASSQWVAIGATTIRYSPDFGNSWLNKEGNISSILITGFMDIVVPIR